MEETHSALSALIERYRTDRKTLERKYPLDLSAAHQARIRQFTTDWLAALERLDFAALNTVERIDYVLFRDHLRNALRHLDIQAKSREEMMPLLPFLPTLLALEEARQRMEWADPAQTAATLHIAKSQIADARLKIEQDLETAKQAGVRAYKPTVANRAATATDHLMEALKHWHAFYQGYDPLFSWWVEAPYQVVEKALEEFAIFLRVKVVGVKSDDQDTIIGDPIGREALLTELAAERIPYTPEELIAIAERELAWCEAEMQRASGELGYTDWHDALEYVKALHVAPGRQPGMIRDLALEAIAFLEARDLVTIPSLARETWRMEMMTAAQQRVNPFFLGGEVIQVSFPTQDMTHEEKRMSMRGNNIHFARATVQHELIPGHHLQGYMLQRYRTYRKVFHTPFWIEGWALYWEMLLWELGFPKSPENRIGMLFWRTHRCARIIFSLRFHLEEMTPQECIEMLVARVGHERANATAEVRRSFNGSYPPLYQAAYMLGGLQMWALRRECVASGQMTDRAFHDAILKEHCIPIEILRAILLQQEIPPDSASTWRFYDLPAGP
ncbi:MAG TPA: DUF885 family protein [Chthonomonadaceae bacterium]|nr:DUF885 family protein [Chthonomonadaceae bacterium]